MNASQNGGDGLGGGIFNAGQILATNCTLGLNAALAGPGLYNGNYNGLTNGAALGGGLFNQASGTFLGVNVTIASNLCSSPASDNFNIYINNGLAAGAEIVNTNGTLALRNSLLAYGSTNGNAYGVITDLGDNISSDSTANFASGSSFNDTDPLLDALVDNGGPTLTMALLPDSPAIALADSATAPPDDQRGFAHPTGAGVIDLGAYPTGATPNYYASTPIILSLAPALPNLTLSFTTNPAITNTLHL